MHLTDCFMPVLACVVAFRDASQADRPQYGQMRGEVQRLLSQAEKVSRNGGIDPAEFDEARFVVCAFADEVMLASDWSDRHLWQREQLQRVYYHTTGAGVEVFDRLNNLGIERRDLREVYSLCLALGFKGRFINPADEFLLDQLKTSNLKTVMGSSGGTPGLEGVVLFPEALSPQPVETKPHSGGFRFTAVTMIVLAAPVVLFAALYLIYTFALGGMAGRLSQQGGP